MPRQKKLQFDSHLVEQSRTIQNIVDDTGLSRSTIDKIRANNGGRRENMDLIADALGLSYEQLFISPQELLAERKRALDDPVLKLVSYAISKGVDVETIQNDVLPLLDKLVAICETHSSAEETTEEKTSQ
ncbi:MAG: hypothetical protein LBN05_01010 [Oscillospiraceae bacterium]|jgi:hypothetical protein|nr:hypothetical protein [Oscillospiraceae bacterium]